MAASKGLIQLPEDIGEISNTLYAAGHQAYIVGGAVRDTLMQRRAPDWDICTSATPEAVSALFSHVIPTGLKHGTVTVLSRLKNPVEVTTMRLEDSYADGRHPDKVIFTDDLQLDLGRRDFTINAMAYDAKKNIVHDPFSGQKDLREKIIRTVGNPLERFREDGLRPLRAVRFAAQLDFQIAAETLSAIPATLDITAKVAAERLREEFLKILESPHPSYGLHLLQASGLLRLMVPELLEGVGIEQNEFHAYDVFEHSLRACEAGEPKALLRLALLFHDIGKPRTRRFLEGAYRFYGHDRIGAEMSEEILKRLKFSNNDREYVVNLIRNHMFFYKEEWSDAAVRRFIRKVGEEYVEDLLALRVADEKGSGVNAPDFERLEALRTRLRKVKDLEQAVSVKQLNINGNEIMAELNLKPGPQVGKILEDLLELVLENPELNQKEKLLEKVRSMRG